MYKGQFHKWKGVIKINLETHLLTIYMSGPSIKDGESIEAQNDKPMFLMINLPEREKIYIDTLTCVASGTRDKNTGSVARLMVLTKITEGKRVDTFEENELHAFFDYYANRSWVRPPTSPAVPAISEFVHLKEIREDSIRRYKKD